MIKKLTSRAEVLEMLDGLLAVETAARDRYLDEGLTFNNPELKSAILSIKKDEDRHIVMIGELIEKLKG